MKACLHTFIRKTSTKRFLKLFLLRVTLKFLRQSQFNQSCSATEVHIVEMALDPSSKRIKLNASEPCSICKKHVEEKIYELEEGHKFCHSCGINSLTKLATKAGESRRQARLFHDHVKDAEKITKKKIEIAKKIISDAEKELENAKNSYTEHEKKRVNDEEEYKRLSVTLGVVVTNPCAATSASGLKKCSSETKNNEIEESLKALEKSAIEINRLMNIGAEGGLGHQNYGVENEGWEMEDHQLRDVCSLLTLGYREVNLKFSSMTTVDQKFGEWTLKFDVVYDYEEDLITFSLNRGGTNTVFSFEAEVQIVSGKTGRIRNEFDENSFVTSELKDGLQKIEYVYDKSRDLEIKEDLERRRGGYHGHFDPDEYAVRFNITVLDETTVSDATTDSVSE